MKKILSISLFFVLIIQTKAQTWENQISRTPSRYGNLIKTNTDEYIVSFSEVYPGDNIIAKYDTSGNLIWERILKDINDIAYRAVYIISTSDDGVLISAKLSNGSNAIIKLNSLGIVVYQYVQAENNDWRFKNIIETENYYIIFLTYYSGDKDLYYFDKQLNLLNVDNSIDFTIDDFTGSIENDFLLNRNNDIFIWIDNKRGSNLMQGRVLLNNENLTPLYENTVDSNNFDDAKLANDGGFILVADWQECCFDHHQGSIVKLDQYLNTQWSYPTVDYIIEGVEYYHLVSVTPTNDMGFVVAGTLGNVFFNTVQLTKLDANGNLVWRTYTPYIYNFVYDIVETDDNGFVLLVSNDYQGNYGDLFLVKVNSNGQLSIDNELIKNVTIYPNPTKNNININFNDIFNGFITIHNAMGQKIFSYPVNNSLEKKIDLSDLKNGVYFLKIINSKNTLLIKKIIKY